MVHGMESVLPAFHHITCKCLNSMMTSRRSMYDLLKSDLIRKNHAKSKSNTKHLHRYKNTNGAAVRQHQSTYQATALLRVQNCPWQLGYKSTESVAVFVGSFTTAKINRERRRFCRVVYDSCFSVTLLLKNILGRSPHLHISQSPSAVQLLPVIDYLVVDLLHDS